MSAQLRTVAITSQGSFTRTSIKVGDIQPNSFRKHINRGEVRGEDRDRLIASIKRNGYWGRLYVRPSPTIPGKYEAAFGETTRVALLFIYGPDYVIDVICQNLTQEQMICLLIDENSYQSMHKSDRTDAVRLVRAFLTKSPCRFKRCDAECGTNCTATGLCISDFMGPDWSHQRISEHLREIENAKKSEEQKAAEAKAKAAKKEAKRLADEATAIEEAKEQSDAESDEEGGEEDENLPGREIHPVESEKSPIPQAETPVPKADAVESKSTHAQSSYKGLEKSEIERRAYQQYDVRIAHLERLSRIHAATTPEHIIVTHASLFREACDKEGISLETYKHDLKEFRKKPTEEGM
jgi:hypothetical protein